MVKKFSALFLALVLCLSVMVVPASAYTYAPSYTTGEVVITATADKTTVKAGDVVTITMSIDPGSITDLGAFGNVIVYNGAQLAPVGTTLPTFRTWLGDCAASFANPSANGNMNYAVGTQLTAFTAEEKEYFTKGIMVLGSGTSSANRWNPTGGEEYMSFQMTVSNLVAAGDEIWVGLHQAAFTKGTSYFTQGTTRLSAATAYNLTNSMVKLTVKGCDEHTWDNGVEKTAPTCGVAGEMLYTCTVCGATRTEVIAATGNHTAGNPVDENVVPASCSEAGSKDVVVYCSVCEAEMSRTATTIPATGDHNFANEVERVEPTCTQDGYYVMACGCGQKADPVTIPAAGHTEAEAVVENEVDATCTVDGSYDTVVYCSVCGEEISRETTTVTAEGHDYETVVTAPTCTEDGYTTYTCSVCGDTYTADKVEADGHAYDAEVTAPTCTEAGYTTYTCSVCGDTYTADEVEALGHEYEVAFVKQPTCAKDGYTRYTCSVCEDTYQEAIPSKNHTNEDGSSALVEIPAIPATCKAPGYTAGERCTICNTQTVVPTLVQKAEHTWDEGVVTEPTYSSQGYTFYTCTVCSETKKEYIPALSVEFTFEIAAPSVTTLRARDTIILHPVFEGEVAEGVTVEWSVDNENFKIVEVYEDGSVKVEAKKVVRGTDGVTTFTATAVDAEGNEITSDTVELTANAKFFQQFLGFFRAIFGLAKHYEA